MAEQEIQAQEEKPQQEKRRRERNSNIFDFVVLLGMAANIVIAVFMLLYYFDLF